MGDTPEIFGNNACDLFEDGSKVDRSMVDAEPKVLDNEGGVLLEYGP